MELIFLGSGSAFTMNNRQSNMILVDDDGEIMLIDCGSDIRHGLSQVGLSYKNIKDVYISHLHADHCGGLEWLAFCTKFDPGCERPRLWLNRYLKTDLWNKVLAGGLASLQGEYADIDTYFNLQRTSKDGKFVWNKLSMQMVQTVHVMDGYTIVPSFGLMFLANNKNVFITTDTQFCPEQIMDFYRKADIIFQDCETSPFMSRVHAHYNQLKDLPEEIKSKMWLYHYQDGPLPDATADGFRGFVKQRQIFYFGLESTLHIDGTKIQSKH